MTFATLTYLLFLAVVFTAYWSLRNLWAQNVLLIVASYLFYAWWDYRFCALLLASSLVDYSVGLGLARARSARSRKALLAASLVCNLGLLGVFKYFGFFAENLRVALATIGVEASPWTLTIVLPAGISFYTFQTLSYTIDVYRGRQAATRSLVHYLAYVSFFPQLVAGPIERAAHLLPQIASPRVFDRTKAVEGCRLILWGLFKKMAVADRMATVVDPAFGNVSATTGPELAFATVCFAFQIYCDFSGYSDIAIGTAKLFGVDLTRNFDRPYSAQSLGEFWRRWHMTLSGWFRDYVYFPLGGSRRGKLRLVLAVIVTFLLSGLWHGASWSFVVWGGLNGLLVLPGMLRRRKGRDAPDDAPKGEGATAWPGAFLRRLGTFAVVCLGWVFFRAENLGDALVVLSRMASQTFTAAAYLPLCHATYAKALVPLGLLVLGERVARGCPHPFKVDRVPRAFRWAVYTAAFWMTLVLAPASTGEFIYFRF